jgi:chromosome segregation ATPase
MLQTLSIGSARRGRMTGMPKDDTKAFEKLLNAVRREVKRHRRQVELEFDALTDASANIKNLKTAIARFKDINERANANLAELNQRLTKVIRKAKRQE